MGGGSPLAKLGKFTMINLKFKINLKLKIENSMKIENFKLERKVNQSGQVALIVLLVMVVMLTLGISIAQRGVADVRISQQEEDSARAFQAAEAGLEQALSTLSSGAGEVGEDVSYAV